jgi:hypothetical protein
MAYRVCSANDDDSQATQAKPDEILRLYRVLPQCGRKMRAADSAGSQKLAAFGQNTGDFDQKPTTKANFLTEIYLV